MFNKKIKCLCGKKIDKKFEYCPYCGVDFHRKKEIEKIRDKQTDMLIKDFEKAFNMPGLMKFPFEKLVKKMVKDISSQMQESDNDPFLSQGQGQGDPRIIKSGISISINQNSDGDPVIKVKEFGPGKGMPMQNNPRNHSEIIKEKKLPSSRYNLEKTSKLPKQEPETTVRRLTDRIVYEISLPGVKNEKNLFINKMQNSIEIRAFSDEQAYFKLIPISLPVKNWEFSDEKLILELKL